MDKVDKTLVYCILGIIFLKILLVSIIPAPSAFSDSYIYSKMAQSFFNSGEFSIHGVATSLFPPLYPIFLSISYVFKDMEKVFFLMKIINVILSTLIFIPAYLLAKEFFEKKKSAIIALLVSIIPSSFAFSGYLMAENLLYPLFLTSFYLIYKSFNSESYKFNILAGIFIGLSFLTKVTALVLLILTFLYLIYKLSIKQVKKKAILFLFFILTILPWFIRNGRLFGFNFQGLTGHYAKEASLTLNLFQAMPNAGSWTLLYISFLALASGVLFFLMSFNTVFSKDKKVRDFSLLVFAGVLILAIIIAIPNIKAVSFYDTILPWLLGRPVGRYIDLVLPLTILLGFIGFQEYEKNRSYFGISFLITSFFVIFGSTLLFFPLFPVNNISLTWIGVLNSIINPLFERGLEETSFSLINYIILTALLSLILLFIGYLHYSKKLILKEILPFIFIFFIISSLGVYSINYYDSSKYWYNGDLMKSGLWLNGRDQGEYSVLIDERYEGKIWKKDQSSLYEGEGNNSITVIGFWINNEIRIGNVEEAESFKYVISKDNLNLKLIHEEGGIKIYET
ncbi:glycosyltransferase family 39 protein [Candidatus Woesearchaeota archaeon]|nr:glycosyltransferase family 39 protein [Candidatus Woesearchaeota archaeon]